MKAYGDLKTSQDRLRGTRAQYNSTKGTAYVDFMFAFAYTVVAIYFLLEIFTIARHYCATN